MTDVLAQLAKRLRTQDNCATAHPLYCVQEEERIYGMDPAYADEATMSIWSYVDDPEVSYDTDLELLQEYDSKRKLSWRDQRVVFGPSRHVYERVYYVNRWQFVCAHLTEDAAELYIEQNSHNLKNPRIYVTSQHRCYEWIAAVEFLATVS